MTNTQKSVELGEADKECIRRMMQQEEARNARIERMQQHLDDYKIELRGETDPDTKVLWKLQAAVVKKMVQRVEGTVLDNPLEIAIELMTKAANRNPHLRSDIKDATRTALIHAEEADIAAVLRWL